MPKFKFDKEPTTEQITEYRKETRKNILEIYTWYLASTTFHILYSFLGSGIPVHEQQIFIKHFT